MKKVYINRQWQGGADPVTRNGAEEIVNLYLAGQDHVDLPVSTDMTEKKNGIKGCYRYVVGSDKPTPIKKANLLIDGDKLLLTVRTHIKGTTK